MVAAVKPTTKRPEVWIVIGVVQEPLNSWMSFQGPFMNENEAHCYANQMRDDSPFTHCEVRKLQCFHPHLIGLEKGDFASNCCDECGQVCGSCDCEEECYECDE